MKTLVPRRSSTGWLTDWLTDWVTDRLHGTEKFLAKLIVARLVSKSAVYYYQLLSNTVQFYFCGWTKTVYFHLKYFSTSVSQSASSKNVISSPAHVTAFYLLFGLGTSWLPTIPPGHLANFFIMNFNSLATLSQYWLHETAPATCRKY